MGRLICWLSLVCLMLTFVPLSAQTTLMLRDNLQRAQPGDYIVIMADKTQTLMHIYDKNDRILTMEEVVIPKNKRRQTAALGWTEWMQAEAPGNTSWVMYDIDIKSGQMLRYYSFSKKSWFEIPEADNMISKLLNLKLTKLPDSARKRVGVRLHGQEKRALWQPPVTVNGQRVKDVAFDAWKTKWPKDGSELSGKSIEVYLPQESQKYPSYFPYWLQVSNMVGKAKIRIIDSVIGLRSPKPPLTPHSHLTYQQKLNN